MKGFHFLQLSELFFNCVKTCFPFICVPCTDPNVHHWVTMQETILREVCVCVCVCVWGGGGHHLTGEANFVATSELFSYCCIDGAAVTAYVLKDTQVCKLLCMGPTFIQSSLRGMQKQKPNADMKASRFPTKSGL